jgi:hypothetical protein
MPDAFSNIRTRNSMSSIEGGGDYSLGNNEWQVIGFRTYSLLQLIASKAVRRSFSFHGGRD